MATIVPRGNSFVLQWSEGVNPETGKPYQRRTSLGCITREQAERARTIKELELASGIKLDAQGARQAADAAVLTFADFYDTKYEPWRRIHFPRSMEKVRTCMISLRAFFGQMKLNAIDTNAVETWKIERMGQKRKGRAFKNKTGTVSRETVRKELKQLFAILHRAVILDKIKKFPCPNVAVIPKKTDKLPKFLEKDELQAVYAVCAPERAAGWRFIANTGLRRVEALRVDMTHIRKSSTGTLCLAVESSEADSTKSGRMRVIPLNEGAIAALAHLPQTGRLFPDISKEAFGRRFATDAKRAGVCKSIHGLRHSFGTHLAMAGVPVVVIKELMGHASVSTTEIYMRLVKGSLGDAVVQITL